MKRQQNLFHFAYYWVLSVFLLAGCTADLDVVPEDPNTFLADDFYVDAASYKQGLAGVYANLSLTGYDGPDNSNIAGLDAGTSQYGRTFWYLQELATDAAKWQWENDAGTREINRNIWSADNPIVRGFFGRCMAQVAFANDYLRQTSDEKLTARGVDESLRSDIQTYRAEARFLRALAYYHMMDLFGKAGFITENESVGFVRSPEYSRSELFTFIETELLDIIPDLAEPRQNEYGRADQAAAWMVLAKLYLNAEVYIGENKYTQCITYCKSILDASFSLSPSYLHNFMADNDTNSAVSEIIFPVISDGETTQNWGSTTFLVNSQVGSLEQNGEDFGVSTGGWGGALRVTREFSEIFLNDSYSTDDRNTLITSDERTIDITDILKPKTGYVIGKWSNKTSTGENGTSTTFVDTDFPMFRLADVYLMYAEAMLRGGDGATLASAVGYVNDLRTRANNPQSISASDLTLDLILNERLVELHWEGHRRQDLIRYNRFAGGSYNWNWKGNSSKGVSIPNSFNLYPIPNVSLAANPNLTQNAGY